MSEFPAIDPEFEELCPPLTTDELALLEASVKREGFRDKLTVWTEENILIDGHNRTRIAEKLGIMDSVLYRLQSFSSRDDVKLWILENQLGRRNLNDFQRCRIAREMEEVISSMAKQRQVDLAGTRPNSQPDLSAKLPEGVPTCRETREILAEKAGVSARTFDKAKAVMDKGSPELQRAVESEEISIHLGSQAAELPIEVQAEVVNAEPSKRVEIVRVAQAKEVSQDKCKITMLMVEAWGCDLKCRIPAPFKTAREKGIDKDTAKALRKQAYEVIECIESELNSIDNMMEVA